jgi:hypothetical protein
MNNDQMLEFLREKLPINQFDLDRENSFQSVLYDQAGEWVAGVRAEAKVAKEHIDFVKADLSLKIRRDPAAYGLSEKKNTEGAINSVIVTHRDYQQAIADSIDADRMAYEASILLNAIEKRSSGISNLVRLFVRAYYSSDNPVGDQEWRDSEEAIMALRRKRLMEEDQIQDDIEEIDGES